jgi:hypothetical protein
MCDAPRILIRLDRVRAAALPELVERAGRMCATKALMAQFDQADR